MKLSHSITVANNIKGGLPDKLASQVSGLDIRLSGEVVDDDDATKGTVIIRKGCIEVRGQAPNIHTQDKILAAIRARVGGRQVKSFMTIKRDDPTRRRDHGWF